MVTTKTDDTIDYRVLRCPTCGFTCPDSSPVGARFCGPCSQMRDGEFLPGAQMREVRDDKD